MTGFTFNTPPHIVCALGAASRADEEFRALGANRVLVVTDPGVVRAGSLAIVLDALRHAGVSHEVFQDVPRDPREATVAAAAAAAVKMGAQGVLGLGGGSVLDVAKLTALLAVTRGAVSDLHGPDPVTGARLPLVLVPTLAGSGAEMTPMALVVTDGEKKIVTSPRLIADAVLLDADLSLTAPRTATAMAGAGTVALAVEAFTSVHANANPLSRALAQGALELLAWSLPQAVAEGGNRRAREALMSASLMAGQAFANAPVGAAYALAYPVCMRHGLPMGLAAALLLPHVVRFNVPVAARAYDTLAARLFPEAALSGCPVDRAEAFAARLGGFLPALGLPASMRAAGARLDDLGVLVAAAQRQTRFLANNPRPLMAQDIAALYKAAWTGGGHKATPAPYREG